MINTARWQRFRDRFLNRNPLCVKCLEDGFQVGADEVDHIVPRSKGGAVFDAANCQPLCRQCHEAKTAAENSRYGGADIEGNLKHGWD